ncbi:MAG: hypothetical protein KAX33_09235 [Candidatus Lokiarchaeota archaeon]|nr:hypothetical protein [Candidatus Lokiarchaeota archaeon]
MRIFEDFYIRNKRIFDKLGIVKDLNESRVSRDIDLSSTIDIDNFIKNLSSPRFLGSNFSKKDHIKTSNSFMGILRNQILYYNIVKKRNWILFNPLVKALIILWCIFNITMLILILF